MGNAPIHTRTGICMKKRRFRTEDAARAVAQAAAVTLRPYRCALCRQWHLTSRTKGMRIPRPAD